MIKRIKRGIAGSLTLGPLVALAQGPDSPVNVPESGVPTGIDEFYVLVCIASNWLFAFLIILAVIFLLYGAFLFFTAGGDETKVASARKNLIIALVGVAVAILAKSLILVVGTFIGVDTAGFFDCGGGATTTP